MEIGHEKTFYDHKDRQSPQECLQVVNFTAFVSNNFLATFFFQCFFYFDCQRPTWPSGSACRGRCSSRAWGTARRWRCTPQRRRRRRRTCLREKIHNGSQLFQSWAAARPSMQLFRFLGKQVDVLISDFRRTPSSCASYTYFGATRNGRTWR